MMHARATDLRGHRTPQTMLLLNERGQFLRAARDRFCSGMSDNAAAAMLHAKLGRYREGAWRRDRSLDECPARHRGTIAEYCWMVFKVSGHVPSERSIRRALAIRGQQSVARSSDI